MRYATIKIVWLCSTKRVMKVVSELNETILNKKINEREKFKKRRKDNKTFKKSFFRFDSSCE